MRLSHLPQILSAAPRRTGRWAAAARRASRLYSSLVVGGEKTEGSTCVNTHKLGALTNRMSLPPRCSAWARSRWETRRQTDACCRRAALTEAPTGPGCGTVRLCRPPLQLLLSSTLRTCPAGSTFPPTTTTEGHWYQPPPFSPLSAKAVGSPIIKLCFFFFTGTFKTGACKNNNICNQGVVCL